MRQAVLTVPEVCSWKPHTGSKWCCSREMMATKSSSLEAGATGTALLWHIHTPPAVCRRILSKFGPQCSKPGDSLCSPSAHKMMQNIALAKATLLHQKLISCKILNQVPNFNFCKKFYCQHHIYQPSFLNNSSRRKMILHIFLNIQKIR